MPVKIGARKRTFRRRKVSEAAGNASSRAMMKLSGSIPCTTGLRYRKRRAISGSVCSAFRSPVSVANACTISDEIEKALLTVFTLASVVAARVACNVRGGVGAELRLVTRDGSTHRDALRRRRSVAATGPGTATWTTGAAKGAPESAGRDFPRAGAVDWGGVLASNPGALDSPERSANRTQWR